MNLMNIILNDIFFAYITWFFNSFLNMNLFEENNYIFNNLPINSEKFKFMKEYEKI